MRNAYTPSLTHGMPKADGAWDGGGQPVFVGYRGAANVALVSNTQRPKATPRSKTRAHAKAPKIVKEVKPKTARR